jgi:mannose/cellobiose epimerase-like protein (N-acyl-D-glucosamine 2-epimerase family)
MFPMLRSAIQTLLLCAVFCAGAAGAVRAQAGPDLATPARWLDHLTEDLLPFFTIQDALGSPVGAFPARRCNDGTLPDPAALCADVSSGEAKRPVQTVVSQSRQVFAYAAAFHMTGNAEYLNLATKGADRLFEAYLDTGSGIFRERIDTDTGAASPAFYSRNVQTQSYGLLGPSLLYELTKDPALYAKISGVSDSIATYFEKPGTGAYSWNPFGATTSGRITAALDPLNTYMQILSRTAPAADRAKYRKQAHQIATYLRDAHFVPERGLFDTNLDSTSEDFDFGHSAKALWFIAMAGAQSGDAELTAFVKGQAAQLFSQAFVGDLGSWATSATATTRNDDSDWWISSELDQLAASLAMTDPALRGMLATTQDFWLTYFVDQDNKGIWSAVDSLTGEPVGKQRKHWEWKSGFHEFEHALVSYLSAAQISETNPVLWFARASDFSFESAYLFDADPIAVDMVDLGGGSLIQGVTFANLSFAAIADVPLGPSAGFVLLGMAALAGRARWRGGRV